MSDSCYDRQLQVYMLHGLPGVPVAMPMTLQPDPVGQYDTAGVVAPSPSKSCDSPGGIHTPDTSKTAGKGRKKRGNKKRGSSMNDVCDQMDELSMSGAGWSARNDPYGLSVWANMSSSESEFSDSEGAMGKLKAAQSKVRHSVLACFHAVVKVCVGFDDRMVYDGTFLIGILLTFVFCLFPIWSSHVAFSISMFSGLVLLLSLLLSHSYLLV